MDETLESKRQYALEQAEMFAEALDPEDPEARSIQELSAALQQGDLLGSIDLWSSLSNSIQQEAALRSEGASKKEICFHVLYDAMKQLRGGLDQAQYEPLQNIDPGAVRQDVLSENKLINAVMENVYSFFPIWIARTILIFAGCVCFVIGSFAAFSDAEGNARYIAYAFAVIFYCGGLYVFGVSFFGSRKSIYALLAKLSSNSDH